MSKRGRPPYPEPLTPRQQEALKLVREGLTNPQIARRLGISHDGAKYLVSEVLGRLGVSSRRDAARWRDGQAQASLHTVRGTLGRGRRLARCRLRRRSHRFILEVA